MHLEGFNTFFGISVFIFEIMDSYYWMLLYLITKCYVSLPHGEEVITLLRKGQPKKPDNNNNNFVASDQIINDD